MRLTDYIDTLFDARRGTDRSPAPPMFQCPFCRVIWGEWSSHGLDAYYAAHPQYPKTKNPPIHYTVCDTCGTVRHLVARIDDEKQRLADLRHTDSIFPNSPDLQAQIRHHTVALSLLIKDLDDLVGAIPDQ